jgi:N6-adenosine-specific RNA methylase IME4
MIQTDLFRAGKRTWSTQERHAARARAELALAAAIEKEGVTQYGVLYVDPPWREEPWSRKTGLARAPDRHYKTMPTKDIVAMIKMLAPHIFRHCVLFLWVPVPMLEDGLEVMKAWGLKYKSHYAWVKHKPAMGRWNRNRHEILLIGTRGNRVPCTAPGEQEDSVICAPAGPHSTKPDVFAEMIERYFPNTRKLELFARRTRPGWDSWGDEVESVPGLPSP